MTQSFDAECIRKSSFGFLMQLLARRINGDLKDRLADIDIDVKVFSNLMLLSEKDGITQRELGQMLEFPEYFMSRAVDVLVNEGYAERRPDPKSRRTILVFLTDKGREKARQLPAIIAGVNRDQLARLSPDERHQLVALLHKVTGV